MKNNIPDPIKKKIIKSRTKHMFINIGYVTWGVALGVTIGWSLCHYHVNVHGGVYPDISMVQIIFDTFKNLGEVLKAVGVGSILPIVKGIWELYKKVRAEDKMEKENAASE